MLAEGFISMIGYKEGDTTSLKKVGKSTKPKRDSWKAKLSQLKFPKRAEPVQAQRIEDPSSEQTCDQLPLKICDSSHQNLPSVAVPIPLCAQDSDDDGLELYRSLSCTSIYKNYPDLQIGGDHIGNISSEGSGLAECETGHGPLLHSRDLEELILELPHLSEKMKDEEDILLEETEQHNLLSSDCSIGLLQEPLSNSVLNSYLEKKVLELYKQYLEDSMTKNGSPSLTLESSFILHSVNKIGLQISSEKKIDTSKARSIVLNYIVSTISGNSSDFSTPNLHFSNMEQKKFSETSKQWP
ncbi:TLR adapter interacting with SLC15A4 on the lysosome [Erpetoichthys calabaricus]|uniref:Uncharacterized protein n=1 Tax=Erpetoichthys calabaricus TaxID=27687 RepID=A0A8C4T110_ERPCA|nr:TLR adapter interacting with SLC15A4 on the lysosome [Erpetoichthys calabaricus]